MNANITPVTAALGAAVARFNGTPASQVLRQQTEGHARNLLKTRHTIIDQMAALERQLADVDRSLEAAWDLISKIDRDGMAMRYESENESSVGHSG